MDGDILFWLGIIGLWLLRRFFRGKKPESRAEKLPGAQQTASGPKPGAHQTASSTIPGARQTAPGPGALDSRPATAPRPTTGHSPQRTSESEFDVALKEIQTALGLGTSRQPDPHPPPPEVFGRSEESFERRKPYTETRDLSEERFERQRSGSSPAWDAEERFEKKPRGWEGETTYDSAFDRQPAYSEVEFHDRYRDLAESPYEFHSATEKKSETVRTLPSGKRDSPLETSLKPEVPKRPSIASRLKGRRSLKEAVLLAEIIGPPAGRRTSSVIRETPPAGRRQR